MEIHSKFGRKNVISSRIQIELITHFSGKFHPKDVIHLFICAFSLSGFMNYNGMVTLAVVLSFLMINQMYC